jgi:hypothetical protein
VTRLFNYVFFSSSTLNSIVGLINHGLTTHDAFWSNVADFTMEVSEDDLQFSLALILVGARLLEYLQIETFPLALGSKYTFCIRRAENPVDRVEMLSWLSDEDKPIFLADVQLVLHSLPDPRENRSVSFQLIDGWQLKPMNSVPGVITETTHLVKEGALLELTFFDFEPGISQENSDDELLSIAKKAIEQYVAGSLEGKISINKVCRNNIFGYYAAFTYGKCVGKKNRDGEYACVTSGVFLVYGEIVKVIFLTDSLSGQVYQEGLAIIESLGKHL